MDSFKTKYPTLVLLFALVANSFKQLATPGESALQKIEGEITLIPQVLGFIPQASGLSAEIAAVKEDAAGIEAGIELLVSDFQFSSDKAKEIQTAAFEFGEELVAQIAPIKSLVASGAKLVATIKG